MFPRPTSMPSVATRLFEQATALLLGLQMQLHTPVTRRYRQVTTVLCLKGCCAIVHCPFPQSTNTQLFPSLLPTLHSLQFVVHIFTALGSVTLDVRHKSHHSIPSTNPTRAYKPTSTRCQVPSSFSTSRPPLDVPP